MWLENAIFREDMEYIAGAEFIPWEKLRQKQVLVTGATGLIGFNVISALCYMALHRDIPLKVIALVRDEEAARKRFAGVLAEGAPISFVVGDLMDLPEIPDSMDYIIHGGSPTASRYFAEHPVEVSRLHLAGSLSLLEYARKQSINGIVFLSSMEVYGSLHREEKVDEQHESFIDTMLPRNAYPEAKRMVESLFASYAAEYQVPAKVVRLTQTFGPGVREGDQRVFAQFARAAMHGQDIVLKTPGGTRRCYLYTADAVTAILAILLQGKSGEAYNAANEESYCSIKEMAECVAALPSIQKAYGGKVSVTFDFDSDSAKFYPPELYLNLSTKKLQELGWRPAYSLSDMFTRMILTAGH